MDDPRMELVNNLEKYVIGLDDTFAFKCRHCGDCCKQRGDIILNPRDLFNIAAKLELPITETITKYCDTYIGGNSRIPIVRLEPQGKNMVCPMLKDKRCMVHDSKPGVCALFPLGRIMAYGKPENGSVTLFETPELKYILNDTSCGSRKRKQTVRAWLESFNIPIEDEFYSKWNNVLMAVTSTIIRLESDKAKHKGIEHLWDGVLQFLYIDYDIQKEFMPQFEANAAKVLNLFAELNRMFPDNVENGEEQ